jgi:hypothetical protein
MDQQQLTAARLDLANTGVSLQTDTSWQISLSPPVGIINVLLRDRRGYGPIAGEAYTITGPNGVNLSGTTGDDGSIKFESPPTPIDTYDLAVCDDTFTIDARDPSFPALIVRVPSWPEGWTRAVGDQPAAEGDPPTPYPKPSVLIVLDLDPTNAAWIQDEFTLSSDDGSYSQTMGIKDNQDPDPNDGKIEFLFTGLDETKTYTLKIQEKGNDPITVFSGVAYADLPTAAQDGGGSSGPTGGATNG